MGFGTAVCVVMFMGMTGGLQATAQVAPSDQSPVKADKAKTKAIVSFEMLATNHMLVLARINGKGPFRLVFDLGAPDYAFGQPGK